MYCGAGCDIVVPDPSLGCGGREISALDPSLGCGG